MGNSRAYPVFRTTDAVEAWTQALRLNALLEERDDEVILAAHLGSTVLGGRPARLVRGAALPVRSSS
ncbi:hypothetical protein ABZZ47_10675 [Streptomyces sp. NPDC006465]|uniref:hypothetical protein n=1 Tax=Streptomyces sp. NPDC006465 TaxID=3157174 RepID=UPI0033A43A59